MCENEKETGVTLKMQGAEVVKVHEFKCIQSKGQQTRGVEESADGVEWVEKSIRLGFDTEGQQK